MAGTQRQLDELRVGDADRQVRWRHHRAKWDPNGSSRVVGPPIVERSRSRRRMTMRHSWQLERDKTELDGPTRTTTTTTTTSTKVMMILRTSKILHTRAKCCLGPLQRSGQQPQTNSTRTTTRMQWGATVLAPLLLITLTQLLTLMGCSVVAQSTNGTTRSSGNNLLLLEEQQGNQVIISTGKRIVHFNLPDCVCVSFVSVFWLGASFFHNEHVLCVNYA